MNTCKKSTRMPTASFFKGLMAMAQGHYAEAEFLFTVAADASNPYCRNGHPNHDDCIVWANIAHIESVPNYTRSSDEKTI